MEMKSLIETVLIGVIMFIIVIGIIILLALGLTWVLQYIPCELLVYIETGVLIGLFMLIANMMLTKDKKDGS